MSLEKENDELVWRLKRTDGRGETDGVWIRSRNGERYVLALRDGAEEDSIGLQIGDVVTVPDESVSFTVCDIDLISQRFSVWCLSCHPKHLLACV